jgi:cell division protein FtsB
VQKVFMYIGMMYRVLLMVQTTVLIYLFFCGPRGWRDVGQLQSIISDAQKRLEEKKQVVTQLEKEETSWQDDSFNKEKVAREQLQMARATDTVFYR